MVMTSIPLPCQFTHNILVTEMKIYKFLLIGIMGEIIIIIILVIVKIFNINIFWTLC